MTKPYVRLDKNDAAVLLVDHQAGLLSLVRDIEPDKFKITCWRWVTWLSISTYQLFLHQF
ncbi:protein YcaC [Escherichia coli]|uniref:Protein YcaC n=1 Tax=Escherichia coli TaxID=562 RepID=A0A376ZS26_ECOLX|nr:protein YcaC [Escherichia coli]